MASACHYQLVAPAAQKVTPKGTWLSLKGS